MSKEYASKQEVTRKEAGDWLCVKSVQDWHRSDQGQIVGAAISAAIEDMSNEVFGYHALQIGELGEGFTLLENSRIGRCFTIAVPGGGRGGADMVADAAALPVDFDNIDLVVASYVLDCAASPHQVLREIERVLVPQGHCILIGFNPLGWRGASLFWRRLFGAKHLPVSYSTFRVREWFAVLGFEVLEVRTVGFRNRLSDSSLLRRMSWLQRAVQKGSQFFGNVQLIHVQKKVSKQIPIRPKLRTKPVLKPGMAVNGSSAGKSIRSQHQSDK